MAAWHDVCTTAPELAAKVQARFEAHGLGFLATLRADGAPRISGLEPAFLLDELWLAMMPDSRKAADLRRDGRFALHSASADKAVEAGDAKVSGFAEEVTDAATIDAFSAALVAATGLEAPGEAGQIGLFRADVRELSFLIPAVDHLDIDIWREGAAPRTVQRY
ncbi:MAG: pyridoxamine 5'-phosphate oxidase family protein [Acidimicrobiia bacterium]|nr:pyridoxamine 5'-phosphate oxidase family protein [Acidimicrobiia bacterium]